MQTARTLIVPRSSTVALLIAASLAACGGDPDPAADAGARDAAIVATTDASSSDGATPSADDAAVTAMDDAEPAEHDGGTCAPGTLLVDGACADCTTLEACGADCAACPAGDAISSYACSGNTDPAATSCVLSCAAGFRIDGDRCVACSALDACGSDCGACPADPMDGAYACTGNTMTASASCALSCSGGFRAEGGRCLACDGSGACGSDCAACPEDPVGGAYECAGNAAPAAASCSLRCQGGALPEMGQCVACGTTVACGSDCGACPAAPANGAYACTSDQRPAAQSCELSCSDGFRVDGSACSACDAVTTCGSDCGACPANPPNGTYACSGNTAPAADACELSCAAGFRAENGRCVACDSTQQCGSDCGACPASPANGDAVCNSNRQPAAQACGVTCDPGFTLRGNACVACNTLASCGSDCGACPANPAGGTIACANNTQPAAQACTLTCGPGFQRNGATCRACNTTNACGSDCGACPTNGLYSCNGNTQPAANSCRVGCPPGQRSQNGQCVACGNMSACLDGCGTCTPNPICAGETNPPLRLECTYFYDSAANAASRTRSNDLYPFDPGFHLWSDGASKDRYLYLPPNTRIDSANMDEWSFPVGTRAFKEFRVRDEANPNAPPALVETRMMYKMANGQWARVVYVWGPNGALRYDGSSGLVAQGNERPPSGAGTNLDPGAVAAGSFLPGATLNALTTPYEIPAPDQCRLCHQGRLDNLLGVEAVGLSTPESAACTNARPGNPCLTITELARNSRITARPAAPIVVPGNATERAALGFLHANCGTGCHNASTFARANFTGFFMRLETAQLAFNDPTRLNTYTTGIRVPSTWQPDGWTGRFRVTPGNPNDSVMIYRMSTRDTRRPSDGDIEQMPPLGSHVPPPDGLRTIRAWMNALP